MSATAVPARTRIRIWLTADSAVTGVNGLAYLAAAPLLHDLLGTDTGLLRGLGLFLLIFAIAVGVLASWREPARSSVTAVVAVNVGWVLGSAVALLTGLLTVTVIGAVWTVAQAVVVAAFAALQVRSLRA